MDAIEQDDRPWGHFTVLGEDLVHKVKRILVYPGRRLSYQTHERRAEHWFVVSGSGEVTLDGESRLVGPGDMVDVGYRVAHRMRNVGDVDLVFIEVQLGEYFGEDDIVRLEDDFGRTGVMS